MIARRLSYRKIQIKKTLPIFFNQDKIGEMTINQRYKLNLGDITAQLIYSERLINNISKKYFIKMKFIKVNYLSNFINLDNENISLKTPESIIFSDLKWYRDFKIRKIINQ